MQELLLRHRSPEHLDFFSDEEGAEPEPEEVQTADLISFLVHH